ncbi:hypothetical protein PENTCL1PPCAC_18713, partial [Pristionchus entomophagus]
IKFKKQTIYLTLRNLAVDHGEDGGTRAGSRDVAELVGSCTRGETEVLGGERSIIIDQEVPDVSRFGVVDEGDSAHFLFRSVGDLHNVSTTAGASIDHPGSLEGESHG